jgi:hypothetical protein
MLPARTPALTVSCPNLLPVHHRHLQLGQSITSNTLSREMERPGSESTPRSVSSLDTYNPPSLSGDSLLRPPGLRGFQGKVQPQPWLCMLAAPASITSTLACKTIPYRTMVQSRPEDRSACSASSLLSRTARINVSDHAHAFMTRDVICVQFHRN